MKIYRLGFHLKMFCISVRAKPVLPCSTGDKIKKKNNRFLHLESPIFVTDLVTEVIGVISKQQKTSLSNLPVSHQDLRRSLCLRVDNSNIYQDLFRTLAGLNAQ